jgi:hypothetical protein
VEFDFEICGTLIYDLPFEAMVPDEDTKIALLNGDGGGDRNMKKITLQLLERTTDQNEETVSKKRKQSSKTNSGDQFVGSEKIDITVHRQQLNNEIVYHRTTTTDHICSTPTIPTQQSYSPVATNKVNTSNLLTRPVAMVSRGVVTMFLDANRAITRLQYQASGKRPQHCLENGYF